MTRQPVISARNLTIGYGSRAVASDIDLDLYPAELTMLAGANGRGKSTLLRTLAGVQPPLSGSITIDGENLATLSPQRLSQTISLVYTDRTLAGALTVEEVVALGRQPYTGFFGRLDATDRRIVAEAMEAVGIKHLAPRYLATLSDGERQKAMIARALAQDGAIIILDEPTAFLDVASRLETMELLGSLAHDRGKAILLSTHDLTEAIDMADRAWLITPERRLTEGPIDLLLADNSFDRLFDDRHIMFDPATRRFHR